MKYEDLSPLASAYVDEIVRTKTFLPEGEIEYTEDEEAFHDEDAQLYAAWDAVEGNDFDPRSLATIDADCTSFLDRLRAGPYRLIDLDIAHLAKALWRFRGGPGYVDVVFDDDELVDRFMRVEAERLGAAEAGVLPGGTAFHQGRQR